MTGAIPKGAAERRVPTSSLEVEDIITFQPPGTRDAVAHPVISVQTNAKDERSG
jgi:hypothetical protein